MTLGYTSTCMTTDTDKKASSQIYRAIYAVLGISLTLLVIYTTTYFMLRVYVGATDHVAIFRLQDCEFQMALTPTAEHDIERVVKSGAKPGILAGDDYIVTAIGPSGGKWLLVFLPLLRIESELRH